MFSERDPSGCVGRADCVGAQPEEGGLLVGGVAQVEAVA